MSISRVQGNQANSPNSTSTSLAVTLSSGITQGNLVVAAVACGNNATTITGPSGWAQSVINQPAGANALIETSIWYMVVPSGHAGETSWTWNFSAAHSLFVCIEEWSSTTGWMASPVDQTVQGDTAGSPTQSTTPASGTTGTTLEAVELWIGSIAYKGSAQSESSITSGWTKDLEATLASANTMTMLYQVASSTGAAGCQYTIGSAQYWAGVVTTFKPALSRTIPATAALQSLGLARTIPSSAALQSLGLARTIPATASFANTLSRTISPVTASLINTLSRTVPATAALQSLGLGRTIPSSAALTVTSTRTIPASASLAASAVFYASNVTQTQGGLTQSDQMSQVSGGTETSYTVTMPSSGTNSYVELLAQGGTASGTAALPAPTGKGWSINLAGNTILAGSWNSAFTLAKSGTTKTGASLVVRWCRRTMDGTYYTIGVSTLSSQSFSTTKTTYTTPSVTANWPWQFISGDVLYMDAFVFNGSTAWASDVFTVYVSNSASLGVFNDGTIIAPQMETTPAGLNCLIGAPSFQTANAGIPVLRESFTLADAIDQRSILTLTGEDVAGTLSYQRGMPVQFSDRDQGVLYTGAVNSDKVSKPAAGGVAQLEHMLTFMDPHYLVDKRANTTNYLNWSAGDMVCDFIQSTLAQENITGAFALESDYTPATFGQGTLTNAVATTNTSPFTYAPNTAVPPITSNTGDLEIATAGSPVTITESTTSDFSSGTLTNMTASNNSLFPTTQSAIRVQAQLPLSMTSTGSASATIEIWSGSMNVGTNDTLNYDIFISSTSPAFNATIDLLFSDATLLSAQTSGVSDQNGLLSNNTVDLSGYAKDTWYTRNVTLTPVHGKTINQVLISLGGSSAGLYSIYVKNCYLGSNSGSPFFSTSATVTNVNPAVVTGAFDYISSLIVTSVVNVWNPATSSRISPAHSIDAVKLIRSSNIVWTASLPTAGTPGMPTTQAGTPPTSVIYASYDNTTWLPCTNNASLPGLPAGANVDGTSLYLQETFTMGSDPTAIPSLLDLTITLQSAANATTSDVTAAYGNATEWNAGTFTNTTVNGAGDLVLGGVSRDWNDNLITNQTFTATGGATQAATGGQYTITTPSGGVGISNFDFGGIVADFTLDIDATIGGTSTNSYIYYRSATKNASTPVYTVILGQQTGNLQLTYNGVNLVVIPYTFSNGSTYHVRIITRGSNHQIFINSVLQIIWTDSQNTSPGYIGVLATGVSASATNKWDNFSVTPTIEGIWQSPSISLSSLGTTGNAQIAWTAVQANGQAATGVFAQTSLDGGTTWATCANINANGQTTPITSNIPQLPTGTNVSGKSLLVKLILSAASNITSPVVMGLYVRVCGTYGTVTGTRISPALSLTNVGYIASSNVMWNANIPTSTSLTVQTTQDLSTYHTVGNNGAGEALPYWTAQPAATQDLFNTNTSANYTSTHKAGGSNSNATWTYDTPNSRITATGGVGALYLYTAGGTMTDMDMLVDMDESDAGGLCWRVVDTSNYYELVVCDASSSSGSTNVLQLNKVAGGTRTLLGSAPSITFTRTTFHRVRVTMQGGLINVYFDGQCVQSYLDTSPLGAGQCGLRHNGGVSRYYQLWIQSLGTNLSGQTLYTKVTMTTSDPSVMPQLFTLVAAVRGPSIATGATISQLHPVTTPFASYYSNEMDSLVQASGDFYWYVDKWRQLHFGPRLARPGAFPIQSIADPANVNATNTYYSGSLLYQPTVTVLSSADLFRSEQIVTNVTGLVNPPTEVKVADGSTTSWTLGYPVYSAPTITVNGQSTTVGVQGIDNNRQFYWQPGSASISYDSSLPKLPSGAILNITYVGQSTVNVILNNGTTQAAQAAAELNSGIVAEIESAMRTGTNGMTTAQATTFGNGLLSRYGNNGTIELIGTTRYPGLAPGTTTALFLPEMMATWDAQIPIVKVTTTGYQTVNGMAYFYSIDATTGPSLSNWTRVFFT